MAQTPKVTKINSLVLNRRIVVPRYLKIMTANVAKATVAVKTVYSHGELCEELHSHKIVRVMADRIRLLNRKTMASLSSKTPISLHLFLYIVVRKVLYAM